MPHLLDTITMMNRYAFADGHWRDTTTATDDTQPPAAWASSWAAMVLPVSATRSPAMVLDGMVCYLLALDHGRLVDDPILEQIAEQLGLIDSYRVTDAGRRWLLLATRKA